MSDRAEMTHEKSEWTDALDVLDVLGHRYPFLLVDRLRVVADCVRFRSLPRVGDTLITAVELVWYRRGVARLRGVASVEGRVAVTANFTTVVRGRAA